MQENHSSHMGMEVSTVMGVPQKRFRWFFDGTSYEKYDALGFLSPHVSEISIWTGNFGQSIPDQRL